MFDLTARLSEVVEDAVRHCPEFAHIRPEAVLLCTGKARNSSLSGVCGKLFPLRFQGGRREARSGSRTYRWPRVKYDGREILYVVRLYLLRFLSLGLEGKLMVLFHELYHIGPRCDGDIRRFPGRNFAHGNSNSQYEARVRQIVHRYIAKRGHLRGLAFLRMSPGELAKRYGAMVGLQMRVVKPERVRPGG